MLSLPSFSVVFAKLNPLLINICQKISVVCLCVCVCVSVHACVTKISISFAICRKFNILKVMHQYKFVCL